MSTIKIKAPPAASYVYGWEVGQNEKVFTEQALAARDAQWQEMVGPLVEAAISLRLALNWKCAVMLNPSNPFEMRADADAKTWARLDDLSAALSAITEE